MINGNCLAKATTRALVSAAIAAPPLVHAQSSVTLYGIISTGIQYASNVGGHSRVALANGGMMPPRFGLRGVEDLGGGNQAIFTLENGFSIKNGATMNGGIFGRQAFVGLRNANYGTITMGRQYEEMTTQLWWSESSSLFSGIGAHIGDNDNMFLSNRMNNAVRYASPDFGGLTFAASYAFSNSTGWSNNNAFSFGTNYASGPLKLGAAFSQFNRRTTATPNNLVEGAIDNSSWGFSSPFVTSPGGAGTDRQRIFGLGASYDFGSMNLFGNYTNVLFRYGDTSGLRLQNAELGAYTKRWTPWTIGLSYVLTYGEYSGGSKPRWHQVNFGTLYALSKRTDLFLTAIYQRAAGDAAYAQIFSMPASSGRNQLVTQIGIRHRF